MKTYLNSLNLSSTLFALGAVVIAITVILTDLEHRPYSQLQPSPIAQPARAQYLTALGELVVVVGD